MTDAERVIFLLQPAGATYLGGLIVNPSDRDALIAGALAQYVDPRLAAAFVLEMLCNAARVAATGLTGQTKSLTLGTLKIEKVVNQETAEGARADSFCAQAALLRREVRRSRSTLTQLSSPTFIRDSRLGIMDELAEDVYR